MLGEPLWFWQATYISFGHAVLTYLLSDPKDSQASVGLRTNESSTVGPGCDASPPFGQHDPEDSMVLKVSVEHKEAIWRLWQDPIDDLWPRHLGFGDKVMSPPTDNYSFENGLLWALVATKHLTVGHKITKCCLTHPIIKLDMHSSTSFSEEIRLR